MYKRQQECKFEKGVKENRTGRGVQSGARGPQQDVKGCGETSHFA